MKQIVLPALVSGLIAIVVVLFLTPHAGQPTATTQVVQKSAYDRVTESHKLRCAYAENDPFLHIEAGGVTSGIFHDILEDAGKRLGLEIVWAEEVGYGNIPAGFETGRYDAFCAALWPAGSRAGSTIFSDPAMWDPVSVWVKSDETRFDGHLELLNDPAYKIADIEGDATVSMADALFPKAGRVTLSQNQTIGEEIAQVTTGKAQASFQDYLEIDRLKQSGTETLKDLSPGKPPLLYPMTIGFNQHEVALKGMFNVVLGDMRRDGTIERIIKAHLQEKSGLVFQQQEQFVPY